MLLGNIVSTFLEAAICRSATALSIRWTWIKECSRPTGFCSLHCLLCRSTVLVVQGHSSKCSRSMFVKGLHSILRWFADFQLFDPLSTISTWWDPRPGTRALTSQTLSSPHIHLKSLYTWSWIFNSLSNCSWNQVKCLSFYLSFCGMMVFAYLLTHSLIRSIISDARGSNYFMASHPYIFLHFRCF